MCRNGENPGSIITVNSNMRNKNKMGRRVHVWNMVGVNAGFYKTKYKKALSITYGRKDVQYF